MAAETTQTADASQAAAQAQAAAVAAAPPTPVTPPTQETKPAEAPKPAEKAAEAPKPAVPDKYEFKAPDGQQFDTAVVEAYSGVAKELGLTQEAAQKVLDKVAPVMQQRQVAQIEAVRQQWLSDTKANPDFGGPKGEENLGVAKKALERFGTPELQKLLNETGLGNRLEILQWALKVGKAISPDGFVSGTASVPESDPAKRMYPNMA